MSRGLRPALRSLDLPNAFWSLCYVLLALILAIVVRQLHSRFHGGLLVSVGALGVWRYLWWLNHLLRALYYRFRVFSRLRVQADALWASGWRPACVHYIVATRNEHPTTTREVITGLIGEARRSGIPARLVVVGEEADERVITECLRRHHQNCDLTVTYIRQPEPGKRIALGLALRAVSRAGARPDDCIVLMDGDSIPGPDLLRCCLPLFLIDQRLDAVTTDECAAVHGPRWTQRLLDLRFAQRHLSMQSMSLSGKVLTLTGRLSVFRARAALRGEFIRMVEADHLDHWLWGRFRFLSGDDKSTWYALLRQPGGTRLLYVPDVVVTTVERIEGNGWQRMCQNFLRWSGNTLRNGSRALALGPRRVGCFLWWCLIDQRLSMCTSLAGPVIAVLLCARHGLAGVLAFLLWVLLTRLLFSAVLCAYAGRIDAGFPLLLYASQLATACVKFYAVFRLARQRWANRGNQELAGAGQRGMRLFQRYMAVYLTGLACITLGAGIALYIGALKPWGLRRLLLALAA